jgi:tRNA(adenine34) deaminase
MNRENDLPPYDPERAEAWMCEALEMAEAALEANEVPVGCVVFDAQGRRLAAAFDQRQAKADPLAHAEWLALRQAAERQGDWRLDGMTLVVTLEPCPMCAGAILMARVGRVIYGASSPKWGAAGSRADWLGGGAFPHRPEVVGGILADPCGALLTRYFKGLRGRK